MTPLAPYASESSPPPPAPPATAAASSTSLSQQQQQQQQQQHKRVYQACIPCRRRKVRCDLGSVDNPHDPPCVRCRRESKECFFSATRRKRKNDDDDADNASEDAAAARDDDAYIIRNGRKRLHGGGSLGAVSPPALPPPSLLPLLDRRNYSDQPLTPGGSAGRHQPLRRPEHARSDSRSSITGGDGGRDRSVTAFGSGAADEPDTPLENYEARSVMRKGVYGPHDALDLLYKAATDKTHEHARTQLDGPSPRLPTPASLGAPGRGGDGVMYAQHAAAHSQRGSMMQEAPIDPQLGIGRTESRATEPPPGLADALRAWTRFRFVRAGWFTAQEAIDYVDYYYKYLSPLTPVSPPTFRDPSTHLTLLTEEPILAVTLLTIASRYRKLPGTGGSCRANAIHEQLWTYLRGMIERVIWGQEAFGGGFCGSGADESQTSSTAPWRGLRKGSLRTLGTIESLMILTEWHPRALHFPPAEAIDELMIPAYDAVPSAGVDGNSHPAISMGGKRVESWLEPAWRSDRMCWMLLNAAMGLAYELGVFDNIDELLDSEAISRPEYEDESYRLRADRIKRLILIYLSQLAGRLGWTNMVPENLRKTTTMARRRPTTASAVEGTTPGTTISSISAPFNYIPNLELDDAIIHCWAGISNAMHMGNERLFGSRKHTTEIITTGKYVELLKEFQPMLQDWRIQFERYQLPPYIRHILTIEYEYVRIYVNSLSLQAVVERCANFASGQSAAAPNSMNNAADPSSSGNQLSPKTQGIYGKMPIGNLGGVSAADQEYIREVMEGSRNLLRTVVEGLLPDDYLKHAPVRTYFRIISGAMFLLKTFALGATRHDVEVSIRLMDSTVEALRTCVVDDVHLGIRFADLLENLTMRLRNRFIYVANQPQAASAESRSPVVETGTHSTQHGLGINGHDHGGWAKMLAPGKNNTTVDDPAVGGADYRRRPLVNMPLFLERAATPANISATPFDIPSNFPMPSSFNNNNNNGPGPGSVAAPSVAGLGGLSGGLPPHNSNNTHSPTLVPDLFGSGGDGQDYDMWFLPAGPAFFQSVGGPGDSGVGMSAEGINVGGMDLLDYMAMDPYPMDGGGGGPL